MRVDIRVENGEDDLIKIRQCLGFVEDFVRDYPERKGRYHGVSYRAIDGFTAYVYRSDAGAIVVRE